MAEKVTKEKEQEYRKKLEDLGFPKPLIDESINAYKKGLFEIETPPDLEKRIMEACAPLLPEQKKTLWKRFLSFFKKK